LESKNKMQSNSDSLDSLDEFMDSMKRNQGIDKAQKKKDLLKEIENEIERIQSLIEIFEPHLKRVIGNAPQKREIKKNLSHVMMVCCRRQQVMVK